MSAVCLSLFALLAIRAEAAPPAISGYISPLFSQKAAADVEAAVVLASGGEDGGSPFEAKVDVPVFLRQGSSALIIGTERAQAFVGRRRGSGWHFRAGQFDSSFGFEANDRADNFFGNPGLLWSSNPTVHAGVTAGYDLGSGTGVVAYYAAPNDTGPLVDGISSAHQSGLQLSYSGAFRSTAGWLAGVDSRLYLDATAGIDVGGVALDAEYNRISEMDAAAVSGVLLHVVAPLPREGLALGARFESRAGVEQLSVGPRYQVGEALQYRANYTAALSDGGSSQVVADAVYKF